MSFLTFLVAVSQLVIACSFAAETGLLQLSEYLAKNTTQSHTCSLRFVCTTTGSGATQLAIEDAGMFEFRHSEYLTGSERDETLLNGEVRAGNLSRSSAEECYNEQTENLDFCFNASVVVHLSPDTACKTLQCRAVFSSTEYDFGNATLAKKPQTPANLKAELNQSLEGVTVEFMWDSVINNCTPYVYRISTMNCGSCPSVMMDINQNIFSCNNLVQGQNCSISVQIVEQCAVSDAATSSITVPLPDSEMSVNRNNIIIIGAVVGSVMLLIIIIVIGCATIGCCRYNSTKVKRKKGSDKVSEPVKASGADDGRELISYRAGDLSLAKERDDGEVSGSPNPMFDAFIEQAEITTDGAGSKDAGSENKFIALSLRSSKEPSKTVSLKPGGSSPNSGTPGSVNYDERLSKIESAQEEFDTRINEQSVKIEDQQKEIENQRKHFQNKISELTKQIDTLTARYNELLKINEDERKQHQAEKEKLEQQIRLLRQELTAAKVNLERLRKKAAKDRPRGSQTL